MGVHMLPSLRAVEQASTDLREAEMGVLDARIELGRAVLHARRSYRSWSDIAVAAGMSIRGVEKLAARAERVRGSQ